MKPIARALCALTGCLALTLAAQRAGAANQPTEDAADADKVGRELAALPRAPLEARVPVTIYEFHTGVPDVSVVTATDMFTTALVESGQFRVVERQRLNQGVLYEKQLNAAGQTTGDTAQKQLRGARYVFEGTVSESNAGQDQKQGTINVGGLNLGHGDNKDMIAVDVRILDADTGDVLDSVSVRKALSSSNVAVSGTGALLNTLASLRGRAANPLTPDVDYQGGHKASVDEALRACIEASVLAVVKHINGATTAGARP
jgi:curli biogenesis system outer membrane secretion channel CsgG